MDTDKVVGGGYSAYIYGKSNLCSGEFVPTFDLKMIVKGDMLKRYD